MLSFLRRLFAPDLSPLEEEVAQLRRTVSELVTGEAERERAVHEALEQLARYWKRLRTREGREQPEQESDGRPYDMARRLKLGG